MHCFLWLVNKLAMTKMATFIIQIFYLSFGYRHKFRAA